jgi:hypothetical protein
MNPYDVIPIPISSHPTPSTTGESWDGGLKLKTLGLV